MSGSGRKRPAIDLAAHPSWPTKSGPSCWPAPRRQPSSAAAPADRTSQGDARPTLAKRMTAVAPSTKRRRKPSSPCRLMRPGRCRPPEEFSFGVMPSQAAKCRPEANALGSPHLERKADRPNRTDPGPGSPDTGSPDSALFGSAISSASSCLSALPRAHRAVQTTSRSSASATGRHPGLCGMRSLRSSSATLTPALGRDHAKLRGMPAHRVDQHGALFDQQIAHPAAASGRPAARRS